MIFCIKLSFFTWTSIITLYVFISMCAGLTEAKRIGTATAIQDYAYVRSLRGVEGWQASGPRIDFSVAFPEISELPGDPFNSRYCSLSSDPEISSDPIRNRLKAILPCDLAYTKAEMDSRFEEYLHRRPPQTISPFVDKLTRFIIAFTGGAALVVPMLIMSLPSTHRTKSLTTVSVAVTLFALLMSVGIRASNSETLIATATYAAVLVVFVGTSA